MCAKSRWNPGRFRHSQRWNDTEKSHILHFGGHFATPILSTAKQKQWSGRIARPDVHAKSRWNPSTFRHKTRWRFSCTLSAILPRPQVYRISFAYNKLINWKTPKWRLPSKMSDFLLVAGSRSMRLFCASWWTLYVYQISFAYAKVGGGSAILSHRAGRLCQISWLFMVV